jgi:hypothetical protein
VREAQRLRDEGLFQREIAELLGARRGTVSVWLNDPDLSKQRARRERYRGTCTDCGAPTDGSNGPTKPAKRCKDCAERPTAKHGTRSRYNRGCSCDDCRRANREESRKLKGRTPPRHGHSGYVNYGCRCDVCRKGHSDWMWMHPEYKRAWRDRVRDTEPPKHGTLTAYGAYRCRCEKCRAASRTYWQKKRAEQRAAA